MIRFFYITVLLCCFCLTFSSVSSNASKNPKKTDLCNAITYTGTGNNTKAYIKAIEKAIKIYGDKDPWSCKAYYQLGMGYYADNQYDKAIIAFDKSLELPETLGDLHLYALNMKMNSFRLLGKKEEASKVAGEIAKTEDSGNGSLIVPNAMMVKAELEFDLESENEAIKTYEEIISKSKNTKEWNELLPHACRTLIVLYSNKKMPQKAINICNLFIKKFPKNEATSYVAMQKEQLIKGKEIGCPLSSKEIEKITKKYPTNTGLGQSVIYELANAYYNENNNSNAKRNFTKVFKYKKKATDEEYSTTLAVKAAENICEIYRLENNTRGQISILKEVIERFTPEEYSIINAKGNLKVLEDNIRKDMLFKMVIPISIFIFIIILIIVIIVIKIKKRKCTRRD